MNSSNADRLLILLWFGVTIYLFGSTFYAYSKIRDRDPTALISERGYFFQPCQCLKHKGRLGRRTKTSTCSEEATWYGCHQKVLSYSFYYQQHKGKNFTNYINGMNVNLNETKKYYPEWILRIYTNVPLNEEYCKVACMDRVFWCDISWSSVPFLNITNARVWRFLPFGDETVDVFGSRDLDSLIIEREQEIVNEWEYLSNKSFHAARDHRSLTRRPVLAGFWNGKNYAFPIKKAQEIRGTILQRARNKHRQDLDELALRRVVYTPYIHEFLQHDSYSCKGFNGTIKPFPKQRAKGANRIAASIHDLRKILPCPVACRPTYGENWTYC